MTKEKIIATGAEAILIQQASKLIKRRIAKSYRIPEIDKKLRKLRTRSEAKIMDKLKDTISIPKIIKVDDKSKEIIMELIKGKKLSDSLDSFSLNKQKKVSREIGKELGKIHDLDIIHGDLTTSNLILKDKKIFFIDFGLGFQNARIEDKAVDIHLFKQALESRHFKHWEKLFSSFLSNYSPKDKDKILKQFEQVELRGRYKH